jgi:hypothetical protein
MRGRHDGVTAMPLLPWSPMRDVNVGNGLIK